MNWEGERKLSNHCIQQACARMGLANNPRIIRAVLEEMWRAGRVPTREDFNAFDTGWGWEKEYRVAAYRGRLYMVVRGVRGSFITVLERQF